MVAKHKKSNTIVFEIKCFVKTKNVRPKLLSFFLCAFNVKIKSYMFCFFDIFDLVSDLLLL